MTVVMVEPTAMRRLLVQHEFPSPLEQGAFPDPFALGRLGGAVTVASYERRDAEDRTRREPSDAKVVRHVTLGRRRFTSNAMRSVLLRSPRATLHLARRCRAAPATRKTSLTSLV